MKSNTPWSIKGIDPDARDAAKKAARAAGMTLGEWLNHQILEAGMAAQAADDADEPRPPITASPVTLDHLRELVASLNRLNDRLQNNEHRNRQALTGLNDGLSSALERIRSMEAERAEAAQKTIKGDYTDALIERIERIENDTDNRRSIDGLKALEKALTRTLGQFESIREETLGRVSANEAAIKGLDTRVRIMDEQFGEAVAALRQHVDEVNGQIAETEKTVARVMEEARAASTSTDEEFIQRTSNKMRILGNEIKRTSDRIQALDGKILKLAGRIDASEQRSAEGISQISKTVSALSQELTTFDEEQGGAVAEAKRVIESASSAADDRLGTLKKSFDLMLNRIEGIADGEQAMRDDDVSSAVPEAKSPAPQQPAPVQKAEKAQAMPSSTKAVSPPPAVDPLAEDDEPLPPVVTKKTEPHKADTAPARDPLKTAMQEADDAAPNEDDFDAIFGEPVAKDPDPWLDDETPDLPPVVATRAAEPQEEKTRPQDRLTPKQKVILAARARRKRMEEQNRAMPADTGSQAVNTQATEDRSNGNAAGKATGTSLIGGLVARLRGGDDDDAPKPVGRRPLAEEDRTPQAQGDADRLRRKYAAEEKSGKGLPVIPLIVFGLIAVCLLGYVFLKDSFTGDVSAIERQPQNSNQQSATTPEPAPDDLFDRAATAFNAGNNADGLSALRISAGQGYPPAQFQLGEITRLGRYGVVENPAEARQLYAEAAEGGNVAAMHKLGSMYISGEGGERNDFTALSWFEQAATYGYRDSIFNLGLLYDPAIDLEVEDQILDSESQAYYHYALAARLGDAEAGTYAAEIGAELPATQRSQLDEQVANWQAQAPIASANRGL